MIKKSDDDSEMCSTQGVVGWPAQECQGDESKVCAASCENGPVEEVGRNVLEGLFEGRVRLAVVRER